MKKAEPQNLYELLPQRLVDWEKDESGHVILIIPKFQTGILARVLQPRLKRPNFRIKLDEFGSFVWQRCSGETSVRTIGEDMKSKFGKASEPVYDRISRFLQQLEASKFIGFPGTPASKP